MRGYLLGGFLAMMSFSGAMCGTGASAHADRFPDPAVDAKAAAGEQTAVLAGGCFWCTEAVFEQLNGVRKVVAGYAGGDRRTAHYDVVSSGRTGHAEAIQITYDPATISYGQLLKVFFSVAHDPTQLNRQGPDRGSQYRSVIFYADSEQEKVAKAYIEQLEKAHVYDRPIVTQVVPLQGFFPAEEYHQDFVRRNPTQGYVVLNALPKLKKLRRAYPDRVRRK